MEHHKAKNFPFTRETQFAWICDGAYLAEWPVNLVELVKRKIVTCRQASDMTGNGWQLPSVGAMFACWLSAFELRDDHSQLPQQMSTAIMIEDSESEESSRQGMDVPCDDIIALARCGETIFE